MLCYKTSQVLAKILSFITDLSQVMHIVRAQMFIRWVNERMTYEVLATLQVHLMTTIQ